MHIRGSHVAVVGGSIAGCAAAVALARVGCEVTVFERSRGGLRDRGAGITIAAAVHGELVEAGFVDPDMRVRRREELVWATRDGDAPHGRIVGRQPYPSVIAAWALVWRGLRDRVPGAGYREGVSVAGVRQVEGGAEVCFDEGGAERFDLVIGADGYRSRVRPVVAPEAALSYGGYGLWRGDYPVERLDAPDLCDLGEDFTAIAYSGGHLVCYRIPDPDSGGLRQNWALYGGVPDGLFGADPQPVPRGRLSSAAIDHLSALVTAELPPAWAESVLRTAPEELSVSPMYDTTVSHYAQGRLLLAGDAGAIARPHTGAGAVKAIQDAAALEWACRNYPTWAEALDAYDATRRTAGNTLVELGKHLGRMRVETPQDWAAMTPADFQAWLHANTNGWRSAYDPA